MISLVLPTSNRAAALSVTLPSYLRLEHVTQIIVVDDGSSDDTPRVLADTQDPRLQVIRNGVRRGQPTARNAGVVAATERYVLFGEDDCRLPPDYGTVLISEIEDDGSDIAAAPWIHAPPGRESEVERDRRARPVEAFGLNTHPSSFPVSRLRTPFLPALALVRRAVFSAVMFDEAYRGNAYREETDFFISAVRAGFPALLSPKTASYQAGQWTGGARMSRLRYEYWAARNNGRLLRKHGTWLREEGHINSVPAAQARFVVSRGRSLAGPVLRRFVK